jgi:hypothetical protein
VVSFPHVSPLKNCIHLCSRPFVPHVLPISVFLTSSPEWYLVRSTELKLFVMQSSPLPCYLIPLGPKYPPQHSILENPQPSFLPQCEWPSFTPIQNNRQDYSSIPYSTGIKYLGPRLYVYFTVKTRQTCAHCDVAFWTVRFSFLDRIYLQTIADGRTKLDMTQHIKLKIYTLKMEAVFPFETLLPVYQTICHPENTYRHLAPRLKK